MSTASWTALLAVGAVLSAGYAGLLAPQAQPPAPASQPAQLVLGDEQFRVTVCVGGEALRKDFGPRFDNTGYVPSVQVRGKEFLGPFGLSGEFGINGDGVLGYAPAKEGDEFLKIGVGRLKRQDEKTYEFWRRYPIVELCPTQVRRDADSVTFTQTGSLGDWAYRYVKRYRVDAERRTVAAEYELTNAGRNAWKFEHYNHNWVRFGTEPVGPPYFVQPDFAIVTDELKALERSGKRIVLSEVAKASYLASNASAPAARNRLLIGRDTGGQTVRVTNDFPLARSAIYADPRGLCAETFFLAELQPGKSVAWKRLYAFQTGP